MTLAPLARRAGDAVAWKALQLAGVKGIFLVRTIILARLLSPDDFGLLAIASIAVMVLLSATEMGMLPALVQQADVDETHYDSAWTVNLLRALCVSGVLILAAPAIAAAFAEPRAADILRVLALKPVIDASGSIKTARLMRDLKYRSIAWMGLTGPILETIVSVALAGRLGVWALVVGALSGAGAGVIASYLVAPHRPRVLIVREAIRPLIGYGRWIFLIGLLAIAANALTQLVISRRLGAVELGLYFLAVKVAFLPHEVASQVLGDVAFSVYARVQHDRLRVAKAFRSILIGMSTMLVPVYLLMIALAPRLVGEVLGDRWTGTEPLIQLLAVVGILGLFGDAAGPLFRGLGHPRWILAVEVWQSTLVVLLLWHFTGRYGAAGAAVAWIVAVGTAQAVSFVLARRILPNPFEGAVLPLVMIGAASGAGVGTARAVVQLVPSLTGLLIALAAAAAVTGIVLWAFERRLGLSLRADLGQAFPQLANLLPTR